MSNIEAAQVAVRTDTEPTDYGPAPSKAERSRAGWGTRAVLTIL